MRELEFDPFDPNSVRAVQEELERYKESLEKKGMEICRRLAEIGMNVASIRYATGSIDGNTDVDVSVEPIENGYKVTANGEDVFFLEFGAGVAAGFNYDTSVIAPPVDITPGSWSKDHARQFTEKGHWYYGGRKYDMVTPRMGMYSAIKEVEQNIARVAKEVLDLD